MQLLLVCVKNNNSFKYLAPELQENYSINKDLKIFFSVKLHYKSLFSSICGLKAW